MAVDPEPRSKSAEQLGDAYVAARSDLKITRHVFLGETSYVIRDPITYEGHRLSPSDYEVFTNLRDDMSLAEIFEKLKQAGTVEPHQEEDFYRFVVEVQKRGLLNLPVTDADLLYQKYERKRKAKSKNLVMKLLFLKLPLGSPDRFLGWSYRYVAWMFTRSFFTVWMIGILASVFLLAVQWQEFSSELSSVLAFQNLPAILSVLCLLKLWHEMGHGYACHHFGVAVPNSGLMFMVGTPLAFVDASGSWALKNRGDRQIINLAGMYFELMIAIAAAFVWTFSTDTHLKSLAHFTLLISSVTTIAFNINPLMKFDGYFVLTDFLGIPNLKTRSANHLESVAKKFFFGILPDERECNTLKGILFIYGVASVIYKLTLVVGISILIATSVWMVGLIVAAYYLVVSLGGMVWKTARFLLFSNEVADQRSLAVAYLILMIVGFGSIISFCPVPGGVRARGILEHENIKSVHSPYRGFLVEKSPPIGTLVNAGQALAEVENIDDITEWNRLTAELQSLKVKRRSYEGVDPERLAQVSNDIARVEYELRNSLIQSDTASVESPLSGRLFQCGFARKSGSFVEKGDEICRIGSGPFIVKAVLNAESMADVKPQPGQIVECRFLADTGRIYLGSIQRISVSGSKVVQHESLTHLAGGPIPVDPNTKMATEAFFNLEIEIEQDRELDFLRQGMVCDIRFERTYQTLGTLVYQSILRFVNKVHLK